MSTPAPLRVVERYVTVYRHFWTSVVMNSVVQPFLYLVGMGLGVGQLIDKQANSGEALGDMSYFAFVGPALIASTVMMATSNESMWGVMDGFKWSQAFRSMFAGPMTPRSIVNGYALFVLGFGVLAGGSVAIVLALFDDTRRWGLIAAVVYASLSGLAFAMPLAAFAGGTDREDYFPAILRFVIVPMFLFAGAFYPIDQLPGWLQVVAVITPMWHSTELCRGAVHSTLGFGDAIVHLGVLAAYAVVGWWWGVARFSRRLTT